MRRLMEGKHFTIALGCLLGLVLAGMPAGASSFVALEMTDLVDLSTAVIQGEVLEVNSFWSEGGEVIITEALVAVEEAVAGQSDQYVRVRTFGGTVGDYTVEAAGFPRFEAGERVFLFLREWKEVDGSIRVTGYQQGQYHIVQKDGVDVAVPALDAGANLISYKGGAIPAPQAKRLDELKAEVTQIARRLGRLGN